MIARRSLLILLNNVLGAFLGFFALRYLARFPPEAYGAYVWAFSALGIAFLVANLGFSGAHIKRISEGVDERLANGTFFLVKFALTAIFVVGVLGALLVWKLVFGKGFTDATTEPIVFVVTGAYVLLSFRQFFDTTFQAHRHTARAESVLFVDTVFTVAGVGVAWSLWARSRGGWTPANGLFDAVLALFGFEGPLSVEAGGILIATAYLVGRAASLLFAVTTFVVHRYPIGRFDATVFKSYKELGLPLAFISGLYVFYANVDRLFLGYFYDEVAVANFQIPYNILTPLIFVATAVATLLFPTISKLEAEGDEHKIAEQVHRSERYLTMLLLPQLVLALVFTREGINIFNERYISEDVTLRLLTIFVFFTVLAAPTRSVLLGTGNPRTLLRIGLINMLVVVALNVLFIPPQALGLREEGAAIVAGIGAFLAYVLTKHFATPWTGRNFVPTGLLRQLLAAVLLGGILWGVKALVGAAYTTRLWQLALVGILTLPLHLLLLILVREFRRTDWDFLVDLLHPAKMAGYVGDELTGKNAKP